MAIKENEFLAICPLDGRYRKRVQELVDYFSESALIRYRLQVEILWFKRLCNESVGNLRPLEEQAVKELDKWQKEFSISEVQEIKRIESEINHDVKAIEYFLKKKAENSKVECLISNVEMFHFGCTSEDINNVAYAGILKDFRDSVFISKINRIIDQLKYLAEETVSVPMLSRTHGQTASPTTMGKELANFRARLRGARDKVLSIKILAKFNGAVGNFNALEAVFPDYNWAEITRRFIEEDLGHTFNPMTTQIEPHDWIASLSNELVLVNSILLDLCRDCWGYISLGYFSQKKKEKEVGSSTMPHKVNPIDFENAEGNLGLSTCLFQHYSIKLTVSRYQRDLSDSTVLRNIGVAAGYGFLAFDSILHGLEKLDVNREKIKSDIDNAWEVLAEPIQTMMRKNNMEGGYEKLKDISRGKRFDETVVLNFIRSLKMDEKDKSRLFNLKPSNYIGSAEALVEEELKKN